ncbi:uncharacterized protein LOC141915092 [Tubulanus polymorphus]|uniref:uncharacterized protein LOC141915092 n=1 Tax=Tubulanus polymorphus TaxID=672921 RepID=UPI003DA2BC60
MTGGGQTMRYPYTFTAKLMRFPWKHYWKNTRYFRYFTYSAVFSWFFVFRNIHKAVNSPGNVKKWEEIRAKREHTHFDAPH